MCFSAEASFGLSLGLLPAGIYCVKSAVAKNLLLVPVGAIPILFGVQQICEGLVWIGLARGDLELVKWASLLFLFFAIALWPFWVPFCYFITEKGGRKKNNLWPLGHSWLGRWSQCLPSTDHRLRSPNCECGTSFDSLRHRQIVCFRVFSPIALAHGLCVRRLLSSSLLDK